MDSGPQVTHWQVWFKFAQGCCEVTIPASLFWEQGSLPEHPLMVSFWQTFVKTFVHFGTRTSTGISVVMVRHEVLGTVEQDLPGLVAEVVSQISRDT